MTPAGPPKVPALADVYRMHFTYVWHAMRRLGVSPADQEDVAQEVFMVVGRKLQDFDPARPMKPWLFGIAYRVALDWRRRAFRTREVATDQVPEADTGSVSPEGHARSSQERALVARALDTLDQDRRDVLVMHEFHELGVPDIAEVQGVPLNTAYSRLRLARRDFAEAVRRLSPQGSPA
jgi:RNA polymerase sigma-70 factor (ECF subfamily)